MRVKEIKIRNFRSLKDVEIKDIPRLAVIVGANGSGKSTLIGVFDFLKDCLKDNVNIAMRKRGGFREVISRNCAPNDSISIEIAMQLDLLSELQGQRSRTVRYIVEFAEDERHRVRVKKEILQYRRFERGAPYQFIRFEDGAGEAIAETLENFDGDIPDDQIRREEQTLSSPDLLAIKGLSQFKQFDAARQLSDLIENWNISDIRINEARLSREPVVAEHLSASGDNIAAYAQYLSENHPDVFATIVTKMAERVPGITLVAPEELADGRVALRFQDASFQTAFMSRAVSDGTIKMFAYLALLYDPHPHPLLCVEEPENQLYPTLLTELAEEFAAYASRRRGDGQVFVTTHSPDFLNSVPLESIYWLEKRDGYSDVFKASDNEQLKELNELGDPPGELWQQGLFGRVDVFS